MTNRIFWNIADEELIDYPYIVCVPIIDGGNFQTWEVLVFTRSGIEPDTFWFDVLKCYGDRPPIIRSFAEDVLARLC